MISLNPMLAFDQKSSLIIIWGQWMTFKGSDELTVRAIIRSVHLHALPTSLYATLKIQNEPDATIFFQGLNLLLSR